MDDFEDHNGIFIERGRVFNQPRLTSAEVAATCKQWVELGFEGGCILWDIKPVKGM